MKRFTGGLREENRRGTIRLDQQVSVWRFDTAEVVELVDLSKDVAPLHLRPAGNQGDFFVLKARSESVSPSGQFLQGKVALKFHRPP